MSGKRIRTVKPEWLEDEGLAGCSDTARMVSVALIVLSDDYGNGRAHPLYLASRIWPYDSRDPRECLASLERALRELLAMGFIELYAVKSQAYFRVRNWHRHQRIDRPSKPLVPGQDKADGTSVAGYEDLFGRGTREPLATLSRDPRETLDTPSRDTRGGLGSGSGSGGGGARAHAIPVPGSTAPAYSAAAPSAPPPPTESKLHRTPPGGSGSEPPASEGHCSAPDSMPLGLWAIWAELAGVERDEQPSKQALGWLRGAASKLERRDCRAPCELWRRMVVAFVAHRRERGKTLDLGLLATYDFDMFAELVSRATSHASNGALRPELQPHPLLSELQEAKS